MLRALSPGQLTLVPLPSDIVLNLLHSATPASRVSLGVLMDPSVID